MRRFALSLILPLFFFCLSAQIADCQQGQTLTQDSKASAGSRNLPYPFFQPQAPVRDDQAVQIVRTALSKMGAENRAAVIQNCVLTGTSDVSSKPELHREFTWTIAGDEFHLEGKGAKGTNFFVSGHGTPAHVFNGKATVVNYHVARATVPYYLPGLMLSRELANANFSVKYVGTSEVEGHKAAKVHLGDLTEKLNSLLTPQDWYFDLGSGLPLRVEFRMPTNENAADFIKGTYDFTDFRLVEEMLTPFQVSFADGQNPTRLISFTSITFNVGVSPSIFDSPQEVGR